MNSPVTSADRSRAIGALLIDAGRLTPENAERVLRACRENGGRFGDVAIQLGVITQADVDFALARQFDYTYLQPGDSSVATELVAAFAPHSDAVESLRALRTQLLLRWFDGATPHKALAIISPERGEGRSWLTANLAVVFSQLGERTLLIDADMRNPRQHELFHIENRVGLSAVLSGRAGVDVIRRITPLLGLSVLPAGALPPNPAELLARSNFSQLLERLAESFDVILLDTPANSASSDAQTIAARVGGGVIVVRKNVSSLRETRACVDFFQQAGLALAGSVVNEF